MLATNHNQAMVIAPIARPQHNQTVVQCAGGVRYVVNHNQTVVRTPGITPQHNQTIVRSPGTTYQHNQTVVRR